MHNAVHGCSTGEKVEEIINTIFTDEENGKIGFFFFFLPLKMTFNIKSNYVLMSTVEISQ